MITIDYKDRRPIYQQIMEKVENLALRGILGPEEKLPSVRTLAMDLSINPNTIQRAYQELEKMGVIYTVQGKGCFIAQDIQELKERRLGDFWQEAKGIIVKAKLLGISEERFLSQSSRFYRLTGEGADQ